jgi:terminase small subunit-like protein
MQQAALNGEIIQPDKPQDARQLTPDELVKHELGEADGTVAMAIIDRMACESLTIEQIAGEVMGYVTGEEGENETKEQKARKRAALHRFYRWRLRSQTLARLYARARESRADVIADEVIHIADTEPDPHKARVRMDARRWYAGKCNRGMYGDDVEVRGSVQHDHTHDASAHMLDAISQRVAKRRQALLKREPSSTPGGGSERGEGDGGRDYPPPTLPSHTKDAPHD